MVKSDFTFDSSPSVSLSNSCISFSFSTPSISSSLFDLLNFSFVLLLLSGVEGYNDS